jgi:hypothetical protein
MKLTEQEAIFFKDKLENFKKHLYFSDVENTLHEFSILLERAEIIEIEQKKRKILEYTVDWETASIVIVRITYQSHRGKEFAHNNSFWSNGVYLRSANYPQVNGCTVEVRGDTWSKDNRCIKFSRKGYEQFKLAVEAYNNTFKDIK